MHTACGNQKFVLKGAQDVHSRLVANSAELREHIAGVLGTNDAGAIDSRIASLSKSVGAALDGLRSEHSHDDVHYVSRFDAAGIFQSALAKVFNDIPELQGYGDKNPVWVTTLIEEAVHKLQFCLDKIYKDVHKNKRPLWAAVIHELIELPHETFRAPFPAGVPAIRPLPDGVPIALLADWGGDNDAAKKVAQVVRNQRCVMGIHLGDVYYGGTQTECEMFLRLWPLPGPWEGSSLALNGNHEMYCGGQYYFDVILRAFNQPQSFFCLENEYWRLIGLDTAYGGGCLKPASPDDPLSVQWNWLIDLLRDKSRKNILLSHHQPVSAHTAEWKDSQKLRDDLSEILAMDGIGQDAVFGWFFGHEHRCALYRDTDTPYNARLIGNGCIPHLVQTEKDADPGCTPVDYFNKKETEPGSTAAVSSFARLKFMGYDLQIDYIDEDNVLWGSETWSAMNGRLNGIKFVEYDGTDGRASSAPR